MEHPQLNLHDQRYMDRLLAKESYSRIGQLLKLIELKRDLTVADFACGITRSHGGATTAA